MEFKVGCYGKILFSIGGFSIKGQFLDSICLIWRHGILSFFIRMLFDASLLFSILASTRLLRTVFIWLLCILVLKGAFWSFQFGLQTFSHLSCSSNLSTIFPDTHVSMKIIFKKYFALEKKWEWGGGVGVAITPAAPLPSPRSWEGRGGRRKKFFILIFLFCLFVTIMKMLLKQLRHKVDLVGCFTFNI